MRTGRPPGLPAALPDGAAPTPHRRPPGHRRRSAGPWRSRCAAGPGRAGLCSGTGGRRAAAAGSWQDGGALSGRAGGGGGRPPGGAAGSAGGLSLPCSGRGADGPAAEAAPGWRREAQHRARQPEAIVCRHFKLKLQEWVTQRLPHVSSYRSQAAVTSGLDLAKNSLPAGGVAGDCSGSHLIAAAPRPQPASHHVLPSVAAPCPAHTQAPQPSIVVQSLNVHGLLPAQFPPGTETLHNLCLGLPGSSIPHLLQLLGELLLVSLHRIPAAGIGSRSQHSGHLENNNLPVC